MPTLMGTKQNMSAKFNRFGHYVPATTIVAPPNIVLKITEDKIHIGFGKRKKIKKPQNDLVKIAGYAPRHVKEVKLDKKANYSVGDTVNVSIFAVGDEVKVTGTTKGKGFAGGVKRWGFHGGPKTHGQSDRHRAPGSIGQTTTPGRVFKGKHMAGHMGNAQLTVRGLEVVEVDSANNLLVVKGAVPGPKNGLLVIQKTGKAKRYTPPPEPKDSEEEEEKEVKAANTEDTEKVKAADKTVENTEVPKEATENANK